MVMNSFNFAAMKKIIYFTLAAALSAATLVSCNKIIEDEINSSRGRDIYEAPSPDAGAAPTTIGRFTLDCFVSLGFEYHWTL